MAARAAQLLLARQAAQRDPGPPFQVTVAWDG
jgi:hypothetical protein